MYVFVCVYVKRGYQGSTWRHETGADVLRVCMYVCMYVCVCECVYVHLCICMSVYEKEGTMARRDDTGADVL